MKAIIEADEGEEAFPTIRHCVFRGLGYDYSKPHFHFHGIRKDGRGLLHMEGVAVTPIGETIHIDDVPWVFRWLAKRWVIGRRI